MRSTRVRWIVHVVRMDNEEEFHKHQDGNRHRGTRDTQTRSAKDLFGNTASSSVCRRYFYRKREQSSQLNFMISGRMYSHPHHNIFRKRTLPGKYFSYGVLS